MNSFQINKLYTDTYFFKTKKIPIQDLDFDTLLENELIDFAFYYGNFSKLPKLTLKKKIHNQISLTYKNILSENITFEGINFFKYCKPILQLESEIYYSYKFKQPQYIAICSDLIENQIWNNQLLPILHIPNTNNKTNNYRYFPLINKRFKNIKIKFKVLDND